MRTALTALIMALAFVLPAGASEEDYTPPPPLPCDVTITPEMLNIGYVHLGDVGVSCTVALAPGINPSQVRIVAPPGVSYTVVSGGGQ